MFPFDYCIRSFQRCRSLFTWLKRLCFKSRLILLTEKDLADYEALTYLSVEQIRRAYELFEGLGAQFTEDDTNPTVHVSRIMNSPELRQNPFRDQIIKIFANYGEFMSFDEFLYMISVFSTSAPVNIKAYYAFKIYDFNGDDLICREDLSTMITRIKGVNPLKSWVYEELIDHILTETDIDQDGFINYPEFEHKMSKNPAFAAYFVMRV